MLWETGAKAAACRQRRQHGQLVASRVAPQLPSSIPRRGAAGGAQRGAAPGAHQLSSPGSWGSLAQATPQRPLWSTTAVPTVGEPQVRQRSTPSSPVMAITSHKYCSASEWLSNCLGSELLLNYTKLQRNLFSEQ